MFVGNYKQITFTAPRNRGFFLSLKMQHTQTITNEKIAVTVSLPNPAVVASRILRATKELFSTVYNPFRKAVTEAAITTTERTKKLSFPKLDFGKSFKKKRILKIALPILLVILVVAGIATAIKNLPDAKGQSVAGTNTVKVSDATATQVVDKHMSFPLKDEKGALVGNFDYVIQSAELRKQIIVQGRSASAIDGRVFLTLNLKITNNLKKTIQLNTRDYLRLVVASNPNEQLAPDIHNDPVEVQAISTKYTRVGIAINEEDARKPILIKAGEINGDKQTIPLNFK